MNKPKLIFAILLMMPLIVLASVALWSFVISVHPQLFVGGLICGMFFVGGKLLGEALDGN